MFIGIIEVVEKFCSEHSSHQDDALEGAAGEAHSRVPPFKPLEIDEANYKTAWAESSIFNNSLDIGGRCNRRFRSLKNRKIHFTLKQENIYQHLN